MNNWISALLNIGMRKNMFKMFGRKRNNRGMMWTSLLGLGVSAVAYGLGKNRNRNMQNPVEHVTNRSRTQTANPMLKAALTEFSKELGLDKNPSTKK
ncbi:hypothetical protein BAOM_1998 [Peribacillus asahii]|uniref:Uncharacterized protein n=1 Tax=Peribacillus asahii TaxID=228899 RepID=A0A3Q9RLZ6_9BACI|nr:hypothetical protein [Peribacillus asahii]AZV42607.1 hypothetical protein BAOM_1998 [Peribacillus asahii]